MSDENRAVPMHEVGATPTSNRSVPVTLARKVDIPEPPAEGTFTLTSTDGVLSWEDAA
jgi:hypothetical protein